MLIAALTLASFAGFAEPKADFLSDLSRRAALFFCEQSNPKTGLTRDRARKGGGMEGDKMCSIASTGYALAAYAIGAKRGWITREYAIRRAVTTLRFANDHAAKMHGWFYHFLDWNTGARFGGCEVSTVDSGLLFAGALLAETGLHDRQITHEVERMLAAVDWKWMLTDGGTKPNETLLTMGYNPGSGFIGARWSELWEMSFLYIEALGAWKDMPSDSWSAILRKPVEIEGYHFLSGGSIFLHQMSQGFLDFAGKRDSLGYDYWVEGRNACLADRLYCMNNRKRFPGYGPNVWGLNAGDTIGGYGGNEPGGSEDGTISPTGAIATVMFDKKIGREAAEGLKALYPQALGRYGFSNGINPGKRWFGTDVIGIDLGMMMLAIEDARDGLPHKWSDANAIFARGMKRAGFHKTNEGPLEKRSLRLGK